jgi:hypothetical protein
MNWNFNLTKIKVLLEFSFLETKRIPSIRYARLNSNCSELPFVNQLPHVLIRPLVIKAIRFCSSFLV